MAVALELAQSILQRELLKKEHVAATANVWEHRSALLDLKRKAPSLSSKEDDELFIDKEVQVKRPRPIAPPYVLLTNL
jgi:enhancer of polycomb-like protein